MCGRFAIINSPDELVELFDVDVVGERLPPASYNVAPTELVPVVLDSTKAGVEGRRLEAARWGLVPSFAKDLRSGARAINARAESVATNGMFRSAFRSRRAIVPATGYYEWRVGETGKQAYFLHPADDSPIAFAGLYEWWKNPATGDWVLSTTIITRPAEGPLAEIHDRMPLFLDSALWSDWLDPAAPEPAGLLDAALTAGAAAAESFELRPVSARVGPTRDKVDDPSLIERLP